MTAHDEIISDVALHYEQLGLSGTAARILGFLMLQPGAEADAPTMVSGLGVAKSSLSIALASLERFGLVTRRRVPGARRERFQLADDAFEAAFLSKLPALQAFLDVADRGLAAVPARSDAARRLQRMRDFYAYMIAEFPRLLAGWEDRRRDGS